MEDSTKTGFISIATCWRQGRGYRWSGTTTVLVLLSGMLHHLEGINHLLRVQRKGQNKSVSLLVKELNEEELTLLNLALSTYPH